MSKHTPEPWAVETELNHHIVSSDGKYIVFFGWEQFPENYEANRARIIACVNALAGLNPEAVPNVVEALREAINWAEGYAQGGVIPEYLKAARAALAKLEDVS